MNEQPYNKDHLENYMGILTSKLRNGTFKMELKAEDNPVLERLIEKNESSIELEFRCDLRTTTAFYHNIVSCPLRNSQDEHCRDCENIKAIHNKFEARLYHLKEGDTFSIKAALMNNDKSVLPAEIHDFKRYQPLLVACSKKPLRLDDTPEGIDKKYELKEKRLQQEADEKANQEQAQKDAKRRKIKENIKQFFGKRPNLNQILISVIGGVIAGIILTIIANPILQRLFKYIYRLFVSN